MTSLRRQNRNLRRNSRRSNWLLFKVVSQTLERNEIKIFPGSPTFPEFKPAPTVAVDAVGAEAHIQKRLSGRGGKGIEDFTPPGLVDPSDDEQDEEELMDEGGDDEGGDVKGGDGVGEDANPGTTDVGLPCQSGKKVGGIEVASTVGQPAVFVPGIVL